MLTLLLFFFLPFFLAPFSFLKIQRYHVLIGACIALLCPHNILRPGVAGHEVYPRLQYTTDTSGDVLPPRPFVYVKAMLIQ